MSKSPKPMVLIVLDGWGYSEAPEHNAILAANTPNWDKAWQSYSHTLISGSGLDVGLPHDQMGNSEVGHLNLGAGRVVHQKYTEITQAVESEAFFENQTLVKAVDTAVNYDKAVHIFGLLSPGGVHSHECHIHAMAALAVKRGAKKLFIHAFLDGRDTPPKSAEPSIKAMQQTLDTLGAGAVASLSGRFYAMDRDNRWDRVQKTYDMLTEGKAQFNADDPVSALHQAYERGETDEFVEPVMITPGFQPIESGDAVIFMNYRADRARELTRAFVDKDFSGFERGKQPALSDFVMLTEYAADIKAACAYPPTQINNSFGEILAKHQLTQLRIAETEKYAHVTFFFNGGTEALFDGESRALINSPKVKTYDLQPEMSAYELTDKLVEAISLQQYDAIICNYANPDMVGHTGNFEATVKAIEALDECLGRVFTALKEVGGEALVTADHGNAECMVNPETQQAHTAHTTSLVPLLYIGRPLKLKEEGGVLADIAPTLLALMGLEQPSEMTGKSLVDNHG